MALLLRLWKPTAGLEEHLAQTSFFLGGSPILTRTKTNLMDGGLLRIGIGPLQMGV